LQRIAQRLLRGSIQAEFIQFEDARVVEAPLDEVNSIDDGGFPRSLTRLDNPLIAARQFDLFLRLGRGDGDRPVEHGQRGASFAIVEFEHELGAANRRRSRAGVKPRAGGLVAMKEVEDALQ